MYPVFKVGVKAWSIMQKSLKLLWIVNIPQKAQAQSAQSY